MNDGITATAAPSEERETDMAGGGEKKRRKRNRLGHKTGTAGMEAFLGLRIPSELEKRIDDLTARFPALTRSQVVRALIELGFTAAKKRAASVGEALVSAGRSV